MGNYVIKNVAGKDYSIVVQIIKTYGGFVVDTQLVKRGNKTDPFYTITFDAGLNELVEIEQRVRCLGRYYVN